MHTVFIPITGVDRFLHATGTSRWFLILYFIPLIGQIFGWYKFTKFLAKSRGTTFISAGVRLLVLQGFYVLYAAIKARAPMPSGMESASKRKTTTPPNHSGATSKAGGWRKRIATAWRSASESHRALCAIGITIIVVISLYLALNTLGARGSPLTVDFRRSKRTSLGQPVFINRSDTPLVNIEVRVERKNNSPGPQTVIDKLNPNEELILPRGSGWVLEPGEAVVVTLDDSSMRRLIFQ